MIMCNLKKYKEGEYENEMGQEKNTLLYDMIPNRSWY